MNEPFNKSSNNFRFVPTTIQSADFGGIQFPHLVYYEYDGVRYELSDIFNTAANQLEIEVSRATTAEQDLKSSLDILSIELKNTKEEFKVSIADIESRYQGYNGTLTNKISYIEEENELLKSRVITLENIIRVLTTSNN